MFTWRPEEGVLASRTGVTDNCEQPCVHYELNPGFLQEQQALLRDESFLQL